MPFPMVGGSPRGSSHDEDPLGDLYAHKCRVLIKTPLNSILKLLSIIFSSPKSLLKRNILCSVITPILTVLIHNA
jgi:hypothetical protein